MLPLIHSSIHFCSHIFRLESNFLLLVLKDPQALPGMLGDLVTLLLSARSRQISDFILSVTP